MIKTEQRMIARVKVTKSIGLWSKKIEVKDATGKIVSVILVWDDGTVIVRRAEKISVRRDEFTPKTWESKDGTVYITLNKKE